MSLKIGFVGDLPTAPNRHAAAQCATAEHRELVSADQARSLARKTGVIP
jgi:hypothetical protein